MAYRKHDMEEQSERLKYYGIPADYYVGLGKTVEELRVQRGISKRSMTQMMGCSMNTIRSIENGKQNITLTEVILLTKILGVSMEELLADTVEVRKPAEGGNSLAGRYMNSLPMEQLTRLLKISEKYYKDILRVVNERQQDNTSKGEAAKDE